MFLKAGLTRSKSVFVYLYMDLLSFPMVQAYSHREGSQRAISNSSDIFTLCLKEECDVLCTWKFSLNIAKAIMKIIKEM